MAEQRAFSVTIEGTHSEDSTRGFYAACDGFAAALEPLGFTVTSMVPTSGFTNLVAEAEAKAAKATKATTKKKAAAKK